ncbi:LysR family transcriptional regulator [Vulgatibacter sp.]|uniref:LysR family transcriptional regulator n=1 Tax=Vulgatibacter sp. TaxID=1971226 RepID=UPI003565B3DA
MGRGSLGFDDIGSMVLFAHVVRSRSFTEAARREGVTKSSVSRRIAQLEETLGVKLLRRTTRKLDLTEEGMHFYEHCALVLDQVDAAAESVVGASEELKGPIRISAPVTLSQLHLGRAIAGFLIEHPAIEVHLTADDRLVDVVEGGFDVVVRIGRLAASSLVARRLAADRLVVCGAPSYFERNGVPETPGDLLHHNCLHYANVPLSGEWRFRGESGPEVVPVRGTLTSSDGTVLREAAIAGLGLVVVPRFMVAAELEAGSLVQVLSRWRRGAIGVFAVTAPGRQLPQRTRALLEALARHFAAAPAFTPA